MYVAPRRAPGIREDVVQAIRESLPKFAERNNVRLTEDQMDNLAQWVANSVPPRRYRRGCGPEDPDLQIACACTGHCQLWYRIPDDE